MSPATELESVPAQMQTRQSSKQKLATCAEGGSDVSHSMAGCVPSTLHENGHVRSQACPPATFMPPLQPAAHCSNAMHCTQQGGLWETPQTVAHRQKHIAMETCVRQLQIELQVCQSCT